MVAIEILAKSEIFEGVFRTDVFFDDNYTISILKVLPKAKIYEHKHTDDCEIYYFFNDNKIKLCQKGESHSYENNTDDTIYILSIKSKKDLTHDIFECVYKNPLMNVIGITKQTVY